MGVDFPPPVEPDEVMDVELLDDILMFEVSDFRGVRKWKRLQ